LGHSATQKPSSPGYIMTCRMVSAQFYLILHLRPLINLLGIEATARKKMWEDSFGKMKRENYADIRRPWARSAGGALSAESAMIPAITQKPSIFQFMLECMLQRVYRLKGI
ncbi:MAG: hypothetical protein ACP5D6_11720, partial [Kosmotogaceae bacterium]